MLSETDIINMLKFLIDNIFAMLGGCANEIAKPRIIQWKDIIYIAEREIRGSG
jgi:hypothetical protein